MMFGGKKQLEEQVTELKEQNRKKERVMKELRSSKLVAEEKFDTLASSRVQLEQHVGQIAGEVSRISELTEKSCVAAGDVHSTMMSVNNAVESFDATHSVFLGQLKEQNEKMAEFLEQHRRYGEPLAHLDRVQEQSMSAAEKEKLLLGEMKEYARTMGVLALNTAIEAGRLGESALGFILAAEEVRAFSEKYEASVDILAEELKASQARTEQLEKEITQLKTVFKECTTSVGKLYSGGVQELAAYEAGQIHLREHFNGNTLGRADALQQAGEEFVQLQQELNRKIAVVKEEIAAQKKSINDLETIYQDLLQSAQNA